MVCLLDGVPAAIETVVELTDDTPLHVINRKKPLRCGYECKRIGFGNERVQATTFVTKERRIQEVIS